MTPSPNLSAVFRALLVEADWLVCTVSYLVGMKLMSAGGSTATSGQPDQTFTGG